MSDTIPRLSELDSTLGLLADGYLFGEKRFDKVGDDRFRTRLLGRPVTVIRGAEAADVFYGHGNFSRDRAMPTTVTHLLQDEGSVQTLSGAEHHARKAMFLRLLTRQEELDSITDLFEEEWRKAYNGWSGTVVLQDELVGILSRAIRRWTGATVTDAEQEAWLAKRLGEMVEEAGSFGPGNWIARLHRHKVERWAREQIEQARREHPDTPLGELAQQRNPDGSLLSVPVAAVELINVLRPVVAVARFIVFVALVLDRNRRQRQEVADGDDDAPAWRFVQEVRRTAPFFPVIAGTAQKDFEWNGAKFDKGQWVMLDIYGTNHDARIWPKPEEFRPERFEDWDGDPNALIPQGAADVATGHRCPGEKLTIALMTRACALLARETPLVLPSQDASVSLRRFPALPESGLIVQRA